ncbi:LysR family transcriptional regulator [Iodobacter fluviatilis]|jgi:DNA-binding transcriptional LysR family regulator|uniref:HTH lysR-type domain-containing protein n=1 Tax=Iodobacter fluviatilis TaxID=537 RepID=A0A7G3GA98_9NEIS|nr:LysR family transcriptional regulator [Iodobacter fluviatilis]QBC44119.1 hypothetical protein C1H71_11660 [Iodobacter fluviatilis]
MKRLAFNSQDAALLRSFVGMVRSGSINRAAILQGKTQPALSQQIQRLEQQLGQSLLLRSPRGIRLSPAGEALLPYAERILSLTDQLSLKPVLPSEQQRSIGLVEAFVSGHPRLRLRVDVADKQTLFAAFERKELDVLVSMPLAVAVTPDQALSLPLNWFLS